MKFQKEKVILTGYRETGKTSFGKIFAYLLDFKFIDTNQAIKKKQGDSFVEMVDRGGRVYFS